MIGEIVRLHEIATGKELIGGVNAAKILTRDSHETWKTCTGADEHSLKAILLHKLVNGKESTGNSIALDFYPQLLQVVDFLFNNFFLWQTELRNTIGQYAAGGVKCLKNCYLISSLCQVSSCSKSCRACADDCHLLGIRSIFNGLYFLVLCHCPVCSKTLKTANANRFATLSKETVLLALALLGTYTSAYRRQGAGFLYYGDGSVKIPFLHFGNESWNIYFHRASLAALGNLAVQAAVCLSHSGFLIIAQGYLIKIMSTNLGILLRHFMLFKYQCHNYLPPKPIRQI